MRDAKGAGVAFIVGGTRSFDSCSDLSEKQWNNKTGFSPGQVYPNFYKMEQDS